MLYCTLTDGIIRFQRLMTLDFFERFNENLRRYPDRVAFVNLSEEGRESLTFKQLGDEIRSISSHLRAQGIGPGTTVGILMENHPRWGVGFVAAQSAGAVIVPLDVQHTAETLAYLIRHSECSFLLSSAKMAPLLSRIQEHLPQPLPVLMSQADTGYPDWDQVASQETSEEIPIPLVAGELDETALIMYTSGTTGDPKGVMLTRRSMFRNIVEILKLVEITEEDNFLGVLPLYHILALMVNFLAPLYTSSRSTYLNVLDAPRILKTFRDEDVTIFVCVPQFYYLVHRRIFQEIDGQPRLLRFLFRRLFGLSRFCNRNLRFNPGRFFFSKVHRPFGKKFRIFGVGGARFDPAIAEDFRDLGFTLLQAYGMTETAAVATMVELNSRLVGSVGRPLPHVEIKISQPDDTGTGEVLIRGENLMQGYYKRPQATAKAIDSEGWLHSGDLGHLSKGGHLHITGRAKDVIVLSSGKNIYPEEIEEHYQKHCPYIQEMCVLGMDDSNTALKGEQLHAVVIPDFDQLRADQIPNAADMIRYLLETLSAQLPPHKRVHSFDVWQEPLPRTTTRKIKRFEVGRQLKNRRQAEPSALPESAQPRTPVEETLFALIRQIKPNTAIRPEMHTELDLGLDSLERVELLSNAASAFQISIPDEEGARVFTVEEIAAFIEERMGDEAVPSQESRKSWSEILREPLSESDRAMVEERLRRRAIVEWLFVLFAWSNRLFYTFFFRLHIEGRQNLPTRYPFLICPNHLSFLDAFVVGAPLPPRILRRMFSLGYADYFSKGLVRFLGRLVKVIPVNADRHLRQALRLAAEGIERELVLMVFPEGERSMDGTLKRFRGGPAILATTLKVPVVPTGITGTYQAWPRGSNRIRLHPITVRFGTPLQPREKETPEEFNSRLTDAVAALIDT